MTFFLLIDNKVNRRYNYNDKNLAWRKDKESKQPKKLADLQSFQDHQVIQDNDEINFTIVSSDKGQVVISDDDTPKDGEKLDGDVEFIEDKDHLVGIDVNNVEADDDIKLLAVDPEVRLFGKDIEKTYCNGDGGDDGMASEDCRTGFDNGDETDGNDIKGMNVEGCLVKGINEDEIKEVNCNDGEKTDGDVEGINADHRKKINDDDGEGNDEKNCDNHDVGNGIDNDDEDKDGKNCSMDDGDTVMTGNGNSQTSDNVDITYYAELIRKTSNDLNKVKDVLTDFANQLAFSKHQGSSIIENSTKESFQSSPFEEPAEKKRREDDKTCKFHHEFFIAMLILFYLK